MANIINLATETKQDEIIANVVNVKETVNAVNTNVDNVNTNVNANKSTLAIVNSNTSATNNNLGSPTSGASNATGGNAHAKLNWLLNNVASVNSNSSSASSNAYYANIFNARTTLNLDTRSSEYSYNGPISFSGRYLFLGVTIYPSSANPATMNLDGTIYHLPNGSGSYTFDFLPVKSFLRFKKEVSSSGDIVFRAQTTLMF